MKTRRIMLIAMLVLLTLVLVMPSAMAARGHIKDINRPENHGTIITVEDGSCARYQFKIPEDFADPADQPQEGDLVTFEAHGRKATGIALAEFDPTSDEDVCDGPGDFVPAPGIAKRDSVPPGWEIATNNNGGGGGCSPDCCLPDVCIPASPPGPVPMPYPCVGTSN